MTKIIIYKNCNHEKPFYAKNLCESCYKQSRRKMIICKICGLKKLQKAKGLCGTCYSREYRHETGKQQPMNDNKSCSSYLGVVIAEQVLSKVFKNVETKPYGHKGYDFICGKGFKVDVKCSIIRKDNRWTFNIKQNKIPDYFLCLAFGSRENLNPEYMWLIPSNIVNHLTKLSISELTINKYNTYKLDINKIIKYCNNLRGYNK